MERPDRSSDRRHGKPARLSDRHPGAWPGAGGRLKIGKAGRNQPSKLLRETGRREFSTADQLGAGNRSCQRIHVGVVNGPAIFDLTDKKVYDLKGTKIYRLSGELVGHLSASQGTEKRLDRSTDRLFPAVGNS